MHVRAPIYLFLTGEILISFIPIAWLMRKAIALLAVFILLTMFIPTQVLAQDDCTEEDCEECTACRNTNFYYIFVIAIILFLVFFYLRNRAPKTPDEPETPDETDQHED